ncbi:lipoprotein LipO [Alicyclobacillus cellulosilyticus]|uniref:Lipoprotein LipO n=2 Tax=Alicyclobacillus cellulosilyticus TaxID=1003997 RepID=A0A917K484_9BACL|nr:lipoprotein LipO [Alicyclobacillus cellulosilyticus]
MTDAFNIDHGAPDNPVIQALEKYTNTQITIEWVPNTNYEDKVNATLASGDLPQVMLILNKDGSFINAAKSGAFWDLTPYLKNYPNLSQANPTILQNISVDGRVYGIYRSRPLGRNAIIYRKDWLKNLHLPVPKTIDDFYKMLYDFTYKDPDKNGKNDTYGMVVTSYTGPWDIIQTWFGVPNGWGFDKTGKLIPAQLTPEYMNALNFFHKLYVQHLVNKDFAVMPPDQWNTPFINGQAGVIVDAADRANQIVKANPKLADKIGILGAVRGPEGLRTLGTSGYAGFYVIPRKSVPTLSDLQKVLAFLDKLNDKYAQNLLWNGIEGRQYKLVKGYVQPINTNNVTIHNEVNDLNQLLMGIPTNRYYTTEPTPTSKLVNQVMAQNAKIVVPNPAAGLYSQTYAQQGTQLDNILNDARIKYIVGQIDANGWKNAISLWRKSGGDQYIKEINEDYQWVKKHGHLKYLALK